MGQKEKFRIPAFVRNIIAQAGVIVRQKSACYLCRQIVLRDDV